MLSSLVSEINGVYDYLEKFRFCSCSGVAVRYRIQYDVASVYHSIFVVSGTCKFIPFTKTFACMASWLQLTQKYEAHHDYFYHAGGDDNGGNRMATVLMYLEAADEGGETVFPHVPVPANQTKEAGYSECAMQVREID